MGSGQFQGQLYINTFNNSIGRRKMFLWPGQRSGDKKKTKQKKTTTTTTTLATANGYFSHMSRFAGEKKRKSSYTFM